VDALIFAGVDISHFRLVDLTLLADQAKPFYDWVERQFQEQVSKSMSLDEILGTATQSEILKSIQRCYHGSGVVDLPSLFDGVGRTYPHTRACYYFFAWIIRDAPRQRLGPLIDRIIKTSGKSRIEVETEVLAALIYKYRFNVKTFSWDAIREVIIDRLEGSRRSIAGHEKETVVRTALLLAVQKYFTNHNSYGVFTSVELPARQVKIGNQSYDVSANLLDSEGQRVRRILIPIKTRETEGGGHAHLYSRDVQPAIDAVRANSPEDYLVIVIVASNWSNRETEQLGLQVDHLVVFDLNPSQFKMFTDVEQERLDQFVQAVLDGLVLPKNE